MLQLISSDRINRVLYDRCIEESNSNRIYATSTYLDIVTKRSWSAFVMDDYRAVLPFPLIRSKRHLFRKKINHVYYCQQLGIYTRASLTKADYSQFISSIVGLNPIYYAFNSHNTDHIKGVAIKLISRTNYELDLNTSYASIEANYSSTLRKNLAQARKKELEYCLNECTPSDFVQFKIENSQHSIPTTALNRLQAIMEDALNHNYGKIVCIKTSGKTCSQAFFLNTSNRIIYLAAATNEIGKSLGASHVLLDKTIRSYANQPMVFDFEGSDNPGIALFFKRFGAEKKEYLAYQT